MSPTTMSDSKGAASAAPTLTQLADDIRTELAAIESDHRSELAHAIRAGAKLTVAKGQLQHGEWLPWLEANFPAKRTTAFNYMTLAANVQRVEHLGSIREALAAIKEPKPKRHRKRSEKRYWENDDVIAWVARRDRAGRTRDQIAEESAAGEHEFPLADCPISQNGVDTIRAIISDRKRRGDTTRRRQPSEGGKRLRQLHADKRAGRRDPNSLAWKLQVALAEAVSELERVDIPELEWSEDTEFILNELIYDLERHRSWSDRQFDAVWARMDDVSRQRKLRELRKRADDMSSTSWERQSAANLAEKLERKYREQKAIGDEAV